MPPLVRALIALILGLNCLLAVGRGAVAGQEITAEVTYFEKHVRPLLVARCIECHSTDSDALGGNLFLDSRAGWLAGGDLGPAIVPGEPGESLLIAVVKQSGDDLQMPPDGRLSDAEIQHLENWIRRGAVDPRESTLSARPRETEIDLEKGRQHWAFTPLQTVALPSLDPTSSRWAENEIDLFVARSYQQQGLIPVAKTSRRPLIRRATFDLLGVPPTPEEINRFVTDTGVGAYARLIDRLLASPQYGERWGRHWLDVARYADSNGLDENAAHGNAWRYRDYVIESFNEDLSYHHFVTEQLAGDQQTSDDDAIRRRRTIATGLLVLGPKVLAEGDEKKMEMDIIDEQIETIGRAFMGLTLGCARCHDHKFDPISTEDYYALAGIFGSTKTMESYKRIAKWNEVSVATPQQKSEHQRITDEIAAVKKQVGDLVAAANERLKESLAGGAKLPPKPEGQYDAETKTGLAKLRQHLAAVEAELEPLPTAMAVVDHEHPADQRVLVRGSHLTPAEPVGRGFPSVLVSYREPQRYQIPSQQSGRLQLAAWLTDKEHPLASRVMVNRIWRWHFGRGIKRSTDDFGLLSDRPSHPELLDWLAQQFIADDWSIKQMHRRIMLSATYQLCSDDDDTNSKIDPENESLWRFHVRRLEAEELLDSLNDVSGQLDRRMGGTLLKTANRVLVFNHTSEDKTTYELPIRAVYLPVIRNHLADAFQLFDYSEASVMTSDRPTTTVAPQALFMMNSDTVKLAATRFAQRLQRGVPRSDGARLQRAYELAFGRLPSETEISRGLKYLQMFAERAGDSDDPHERAWQLLCQMLLASNEFCYVR